MGVIEGKPGRMVEVRLVQGKTQTVKTVLPVTVRDARREATHIAWIAKAATLAAYTILETDLEPFLGMEEEVMEEEEEEETTWFFFFPPPVVFRLDIVRVVDELDLEIYNNSRIIEETETIEETEVINLNVGLQETR